MRLSASEIVKRYGEVTVLDRVSLDVQSGSVTGLIGPNGSGKSTLFDVVTAFVSRDSGEVRVDDRVIDAKQPHELSSLGVVRTFQVPRVARRMTLVENLMAAPPSGAGESLFRLFSPFHVKRIRGDERERRDRAWDTLSTLGLDHHGNDFAEILSGGQLKLLSIGIASMIEPEALLLDEPTAGVNPVLIDRILGLLAERRARGKTTFIIEHNIPVVSEICDTIYVLDVGRIIAAGTPDEVRSDDRVIDAYLGKRERNVR
jgi:ABC-type branched-subunit amino acid transport system ATPase component